MEKFLRIFAVFLAIYGQAGWSGISANTESKSSMRTQSNIVEFTRQNYNFDYNITELQGEWELTTYSKIAEDVIQWSRQTLPFAELRDLLRSFNGDASIEMNNVQQKLLVYEAPYITMCVVAVIGMFAFPIAGLVFCIRRQIGSCRARMTETTISKMRKRERYLHVNLVLVGATLTLISGIALFMVAERTDEGVKLAKTVAVDTMNNAIKFVNGSANSLKVLFGTDFDKVMDAAQSSLESIPQHIVKPVAEELKTVSVPTFSALVQLDTYLRSLHRNLAEAADVWNDLQALHANMTETCNIMRVDLAAFLTECKKQLDESECNVLLPSQAYLPVDINSFPNISHTANAVDVYLIRNMTGRVANATASLDAIDDSILDEVVGAKETLSNITSGIREVKDDLMERIDSTVEEIVANKIAPAREDLLSLLNSVHMHSAEARVSLALKVPSILVLLMASILILAVSVGQAGVTHNGSFSNDELSQPMKMARLGKDLILSYVYLFFLVAVLFQALMLLSIPLAVNMTHVKTAMQDDTLFTELIDNPEAWNHQLPISKLIHADPDSTQIKVRELLEECRKKKSMWSILKLDSKLNLSGLTDIHSKIPAPEEILDVATIVEPSNFLAEDMINMNATLDLGLATLNQSASYTIPSSLFPYDPDTVITDFQNFFASNSYFHPQLSKQALRFAGDVQYLKGRMSDFVDLINRYENKSSPFFQQVAEIENMTSTIKESSASLLAFFQVDATVLATQALQIELSNVMRGMVRYGGYAIRELTTKVGQCAILPDSYDSLKVLLLFYLTDTLNALWLALGTCTFSFVVFYPSCMQLARHYQLAALDFEPLDVTEKTPIESDTRRLDPEDVYDMKRKSRIEWS